MTNELITPQLFTLEGYANFYLFDDYFIYEDLNEPLNSKLKISLNDMALIHFEGKKEFFFFYQKAIKYQLIYAVFQNSEPFLKTIKDKVKVSHTYQTEGFKGSKLILNNGQFITEHEYQGRYYVDLFKKKKLIETRFMYVQNTDYSNHLNKELEDKGMVDLDLVAFKTKLQKGRKNSERNRTIMAIIKFIIFIAIGVILYKIGFFDHNDI